MEKKELYNQIMESVSKEVKKALNEQNYHTPNEWPTDLQEEYKNFKADYGMFLEMFIKEYLKEHLTSTIYWGADRLSIGLDIDGEDFGGCSDNNPLEHYYE